MTVSSSSGGHFLGWDISLIFDLLQKDQPGVPPLERTRFVRSWLVQLIFSMGDASREAARLAPSALRVLFSKSTGDR